MNPVILVALGSVIGVMEQELDRANETLAPLDDAPHYIAVAVSDQEENTVSARAGTVSTNIHTQQRSLDVDLRVGTPEIDSTHPVRGFSALDDEQRNFNRIAWTGDDALRQAIWTELDRRYREAAQRIVLVRSNLSVKVEEETGGHDFQPSDNPQQADEPPPELVFDRDAWAETLRQISVYLDEQPHLDSHSVGVSARRIVNRFIDTEGARIVHGNLHARFTLQVQATAEDGDRLTAFKSWDVHDPADLPDPETLQGWAEAASQRISDLHEAPRGEPYSGPVLLHGRAAGVFFHEVLGHRSEGHRLKREFEGKTFQEHVGKPILPDYIDIVDDPTQMHLAGEDLNGYYRWDDEGTEAQPAVLVEDGILKGFLMHRSPVDELGGTNGHGRRSPGNPPSARMGNTLIQASQTQSWDALRAQLLDEVRDQGLEYGYIVEDIEGGFTMTGRTMPNAFNVRAVASWRVWADGRPDELVRGIDLVGTPLAAFRNLIGAGDTPEVFNGICGAESGWVPVSAVAPPMLFRTLEFQLKEKGQERPPLRPKPLEDASVDAGGVQ